MSFASFISARITFKSKRTFSKLIVRIAIIGIMLGLGVMILSVAIVKGFKHEIREKVRGFAGDIRIIKSDLNSSYESSPITYDANFVKRALKNPLITHVMPSATKPGIIKANNEIEGVVLKGVDKTYDWTYLKKMLLAGDVIDFKDSVEAQKEIMLSQQTANRLKLKVGDKMLMYFVQEPLRKRQFTIKGIFSIGEEEIDKTFVIGALSLINRLNDWKPGEIGEYEMRVADFNQVDVAADRIDDMLPIKLKSHTVMEDYPNIFEWLKLLDVNSVVMLVLMVIVAVINMISALLIMILERTAMIGMFKAMGASNWNIQKVFLFNATYLIGLGLLLGNIFGIGIGFFQQQTHFFKLDQASYYMTFVPVQFNLSDILLLNLGTLVICLLVLIIPSTLVSKISPVKAIRFK
ncbi:ABC transporter permease [Mucilaginibacter sp. FT3.2]|uniref:ABC transporter permease n=1 Tax=Mucilaginibacter sp. FT3.2 TaxID=2723090 RepID=UPI001619F7A4|nr:FtsX-like permease family protein [Mucilaginibacter sp. FT3.2]MBB6231997.1 lipoprotein-releasing system permease protein [Mucilaginibacter sp. FT3.2]